MTRQADAITETDLHAYVDDQIDMARRVEVEEYLSRNPEAASRVMADLLVRDELRLALRGTGRPASARTLDAARALQRGLMMQRLIGGFRRMTRIAALVALGWFAHAELGLLNVRETAASATVPDFVEDALHSHRTALVRAGMNSQRPAARYDPAEILDATFIEMPRLPDDWRVLDAQIFPWKGGSSVELTVQAGALGTLSLFAARSEDFAIIDPRIARTAEETVAYWQIGPSVYALTGAAAEAPLERAAMALARKF